MKERDIRPYNNKTGSQSLKRSLIFFPTKLGNFNLNWVVQIFSVPTFLAIILIYKGVNFFSF